MASPPSVLDLHAQLRSQLALDPLPRGPTDTASAFAAATNAIASASMNVDAQSQLFTFIWRVSSIDSDLSERLTILSIQKLIKVDDINGGIAHAWAELLCLDGPQLSTDTVLLAVNNLLSSASHRVRETQQSQEATRQNTFLGTPKAPVLAATANVPVTPSKHPVTVEDDTPVHANSALPYSALSQIRAHVDPFLRAELRGTVLKDVKGFYKFFPGITEQQWTCAVSCPASCDCISLQSSDPAFTIPHFPREITQHSVLEWFTYFNKPHHSRTFYTSCNRPLTESLSASNRQCDLFLASTFTEFRTSKTADHAWTSVLVPVELKAAPTKDPAADTIVQLAAYVREVFGAQFTRRFVHAFTICGSFVRCYLFDRAGVSISERINIRKNHRTEELFIRILQSYASMDPTQLGFDENYEYVWTNNVTSSMPSPEAPLPLFFNFGGRRFKLLKNVFHRSVIVSRGTTVWEAVDLVSQEACIVKDSWRVSWRTAEGELLSLAQNKAVFALSTPIVHGDVVVQSGRQVVVDTIAHVRMGLGYGEARTVVIKFKPEDDLYSLRSSLSVVPLSIGSSQKWDFGATKKVTSQKMREGTRKRSLPTTITEENESDVPQRKVRKIGNTKSRRTRGSGPKRLAEYRPTESSKSHSATNSTNTAQPVFGRKAKTSIAMTSRKSINSEPMTKKRDGGSSLKALMDVTGEPELDWILNLPSRATETSPTPRESADHSSVVEPSYTGMVFMHMTHSVIVSNGVGEEIKNFTCEMDLIKGMRDAIKCHQSLLESAGILHRDISPGNIMLSKSRSSDISSGSDIVSSEAPHGFLIDLDLAKYVGPIQTTTNSTPSSVRRRTGTMLFMAIEILQGTCLRHSWRHDLESFFYVFIWICVTRADGYKGAQKTFEKQWGGGNPGSVKLGQVSQKREFQDMMAWIPKSLKGGAVERVVRGWRQILFPAIVGDIGVMVGEEGRDRSEVYKGMLAVLEQELQ